MPEFDIELVAGDEHRLNGSARCRVVLAVGGAQKLVEQITLDSSTSIARTASRWASSTGLTKALLRNDSVESASPSWPKR